MNRILPGIIICTVIGGLAWMASGFLPLGRVSLAILGGMIAGNLLPSSLRKGWSGGCGFCEKRVLGWAIALMGVNLDYRLLLSLGGEALILIPAAILFTLGLALALGRLFGLPEKLSLLMGVGNAVCGSSAIAAAQGVVEAGDEDVALSVAAVNLFGTAGIFLLPLLASSVPAFGPQDRGILIGNTLQAVGQVTAAGFSMGEVTGQCATVIKMGRILMIGPVVLMLSLFLRRKGAGADQEGGRKAPAVPPYILAFLLFSLIGSTGFLSSSLTGAAGNLSRLFLVSAMAAIGLKIRFRDLAGSGGRALCMGLAVVTGQLLFSLLMILLLRG